MILRIFLTFFLLLFSSAVIALSISEDENSLQVTSLMSAVLDGDVQSVEFFSKSDGDKINEKNIGGVSALSLAARKDNPEIVKILITSGADVNNVDNEGWTPLMRAANSGNYQIVELLLAAKSDVTKINSEKEGALVQSAKSGCIECFNAIIARFDVTHFLTADLLKTQLNSSFVAARKLGNIELQNIISKHLSMISEEKASDSMLNQDFKIVETEVNVKEVAKNNQKFPKKNKKFILKNNQEKPVVKENFKVSKANNNKVLKEKPVKKFAFKMGEEKLEVEEKKTITAPQSDKKFIFKKSEVSAQ